MDAIGVAPLSVEAAGDIDLAQRLYTACAGVEAALAEREALPPDDRVRREALLATALDMLGGSLGRAADPDAVRQRGFARCAALIDRLRREGLEARIASAVADAVGASASASTSAD